VKQVKKEKGKQTPRLQIKLNNKEWTDEMCLGRRLIKEKNGSLQSSLRVPPHNPKRRTPARISGARLETPARWRLQKIKNKGRRGGLGRRG